MIRRFNLLLIFSSLILFITCKKKSASTPAQTSTSTSTPSTAPYSIMETYYTYTDNGSGVSLDSNAFASFLKTPIGTNPAVYISAGNVNLNDSVLDFVVDQYLLANPINISQTLKWSATGSGTITAFTHTFVSSYPKYTGGNLLPDTCSKASGITLNISGVTNLTGFMYLVLSQASNQYQKDIASNGTVTFSASELSTFNTNANISFQLVFINTQRATLSGVLHSFNNTVYYNKFAYLKP